MNKNRNKVAAMMMVAAITVSSVSMPVEAAVKNINRVDIKNGNINFEQGDIDLNAGISKEFRRIIYENIRILNSNDDISDDVNIKNGIIKSKDIEKIKRLEDYASRGIDLTGIEKFTALETVWIDGVSKVDLSKNTKLKNINLEANELETLSLTGKPELTRLNINGGTIKSLDLSGNENLKILACAGNKLRYLDLSKNKNLINLSLDENEYENNGIGYLKLHKDVTLKRGTDENSQVVKVLKQLVNVLVDKEKDNQIDLAKEFPGINPNDIILKPDQGVIKEGSIIKWEKFPTNSITYEYRTQGTDEGIKLYVKLHLIDNSGITDGVEINETNFPDEKFRNYICSSKFTKDNNNLNGGWYFKEGDIIPAEILRKIININVGNSDDYDGQKIETLKGIEYFKNLRYLNCANNKIDKLDVSQNTRLESLNCNGNNIGINETSDLDVSNNKELRGLYCSRNKITNLDISNNKKLNDLYCWNNKIRNLDISNNTELTNLDVGANLLSEINVKSNTKLNKLVISDNEKIKDIDLSNNLGLEIFFCGNNNIKELDISKNINLKDLDITYQDYSGEYIQSLDVSKNVNLKSLACIGDKSLTDINLSENKALEYICLGATSLTDINLINQTKLKKLVLIENRLRKLDLSNNTELEELYITDNKLGRLIVNENADRWIIKEGYEQKIELKADGNKIDLNKEFGITESEMKNVTELSEGISKNGTNLTWTGKKPEKIKYTYLCGGKNNPVKLFVTLDLSGNGVITPDPDKPNPNPNPDQGGSGGGSGTTTPDHKPDTKPEEKPNKPIELQGKIVGKNRYETAAKIADQMGSYNTVILVNSDKSMADGLSAASLSGKKNAPILLVKKNSIPAETMARLEKAENVYIIGGNNVISKKVENQLKGKKITRISGKDRYDTSAKIANLLGNYDTAFIVNGTKGEADAMSVSSVAAKYGAPILLTNGKTSKHLKKANVRYFVIGGKAVVSRALEDKYDADRISGVDRYSTNRKIIDEFYYDSKKVYFAKGDTLVDALAVSALAKEDGVVLVSKKANHKKLEGKKAIQVGGMDFEIDVK